MKIALAAAGTGVGAGKIRTKRKVGDVDDIDAINTSRLRAYQMFSAPISYAAGDVATDFATEIQDGCLSN